MSTGLVELLDLTIKLPMDPGCSACGSFLSRTFCTSEVETGTRSNVKDSVVKLPLSASFCCKDSGRWGRAWQRPLTSSASSYKSLHCDRHAQQATNICALSKPFAWLPRSYCQRCRCTKLAGIRKFREPDTVLSGRSFTNLLNISRTFFHGRTIYRCPCYVELVIRR